MKLNLLLRRLCSIFSITTKPAINLWEKRIIRRNNEVLKELQPIFIIGAPRTGSTLLYQGITNYLKVQYTDNLINQMYRNFVFAFVLSNFLFKNKQHGCYNSKHGTTFECGLHGPSECSGFWYRWMPIKKHFLQRNDLTKKQKNELKSNVLAVSNYFKSPIVFKNMNAGLRIDLLIDLFPNARFIHIQRNVLSTAISLLNVRKSVHNDKNKWWSLIPKEYNSLIDLPFNEQIVKQIYFVEKQIYQDLKKVNANNKLTVQYEDFCENPKAMLNKISQFFSISKFKREHPILPQIQNKSIPFDHYKFNEIIENLNWDFNE